MNIFEMMRERYFLPEKPKLFEAFSGIGCQRLAFKRLGIEVEMVGISEIDKYALQSYMAIHGETKNYGSITDIKGQDLPQIDVFTWSFPCTDLSKAGKQQGMSSETRSGLVYEVLRILHESTNKPKVLIMENVVDLIQTKFIQQFNEIQLELEQLGYVNYVETMNAKNYGVAQNRDRVFMVSILGDYYYEFPKPFKLEKRLKDYLEDEVDEKYYLSDKLLNFFQENSIKNEEKGNGFRFRPKDDDSIANAVTTLAGNRMDDNFIKIPEDTIKGYAEAHEGDGGYINRPHQKRGVVQEGMIQTLKTSGTDVGVVVNAKEKLCNTLIENGLVEEYDMIRHSYTNNRMEDLQRKENENGVSATLTTRPDTLGVVVPFGSYYTWPDNQGNINTQCNRAADEDGYALTVACAETGKVFEDKLRIRKLTPIEVWRLMGIDDEDFYKAQASGVSNSQLYKQAGNGIVVDVFAKIIENMTKGDL